jgi:hypothetical protein
MGSSMLTGMPRRARNRLTRCRVKAVIAVVGATLAVPFLAVAAAPQAHAIDRCTIWYTPMSMDQYNLCEQHSQLEQQYKNCLDQYAGVSGGAAQYCGQDPGY